VLYIVMGRRRKREGGKLGGRASFTSFNWSYDAGKGKVKYLLDVKLMVQKRRGGKEIISIEEKKRRRAIINQRPGLGGNKIFGNRSRLQLYHCRFTKDGGKVTNIRERKSRGVAGVGTEFTRQ